MVTNPIPLYNCIMFTDAYIIHYIRFQLYKYYSWNTTRNCIYSISITIVQFHPQSIHPQTNTQLASKYKSSPLRRVASNPVGYLSPADLELRITLFKSPQRPWAREHVSEPRAQQRQQHKCVVATSPTCMRVSSALLAGCRSIWYYYCCALYLSACNCATS